MRNCESGLNIVYRLLIALFFIAAPIIGKAQDLPCNDADPFENNCPLDTWVIALVVIAGIFAALHLHRKQKSLRA